MRVYSIWISKSIIFVLQNIDLGLILILERVRRNGKTRFKSYHTMKLERTLSHVQTSSGGKEEIFAHAPSGKSV